RWSSPAEASRFPSGLKTTRLTFPVCPDKVRRGRRPATSQSRTAWSQPAEESVPVRAEGDVPDLIGVPGEGAGFLAGGQVPQPYRAVLATGGQELAVRAEGHGNHHGGVARSGEARPARGRVVEPHDALVVGRGGQRLAVRAEPVV